MTSKRQVTFPRHVVDKLRLKEGDAFHISETRDGILIKPHRFHPEKLAPLRHLIDADLPAPFPEILRQEGGAGLMDRLIVQDYQANGLRFDGTT